MVDAMSSGQADWSQNDPDRPDYIKNRPGGYDSSEPIEITWDGNIGDKETIQLSESVAYVHVSDEVFTLEQLEGVKTTKTTVSGGEETYDDPYAQFTDEIIGVELCLIVSVAGAVIDETTFPVAGIYFAKIDDSKKDKHYFISKITIPAKVEKIPNKYLDAPSLDALAEVKSTAETAKSTAETAKSTAETAKSTAKSADDLAYSAKYIANTAQTTANQCVKFQVQSLTSEQKQQARKNIDAISYSSKEYEITSGTVSHQFGKTAYYYCGLQFGELVFPKSGYFVEKYYVNSKPTTVYRDTASGCLAMGKTALLNELVQYDLFREIFPFDSSKTYSESQFIEDTLDILIVYNQKTFWGSIFSHSNIGSTTLTDISDCIDFHYIPVDGALIKYNRDGQLTLSTVSNTGLILRSSTNGSAKKFKITVDDTGALTATEIIS